eukprot:1786401-Alexandrium_andersonii.AAC.1
MLVSRTQERVWFVVHCDVGPMLVCSWYRPPDHGNVEGIESLTSEFDSLSASAIGCLIIGDLNVHNAQWLRFSSHTAPEGRLLQEWCMERGFRERVRAPTRGPHLLDL